LFLCKMFSTNNSEYGALDDDDLPGSLSETIDMEVLRERKQMKQNMWTSFVDRINLALDANKCSLLVFTALCAIYALLGATAWKQMTWHGWSAIGATTMLLFALVLEISEPAFCFAAAILFMITTQVLTVEQATQGFSQPLVLVLAVLYVISHCIQESGLLSYLVTYALGKPKSERVALVRLLVPIAVVSAFMNNTPIVAMLAPVVEKWAEECGFSPAVFLMPLSFAVILGGMNTLIGTSVNLVVVSLYSQKDVLNKADDFDFFGPLKLTGPGTVFGLLYMIAFAPILLKPRENAKLRFTKKSSAYSTAMFIPENSVLVGKTVGQAGLDNLVNIALDEIGRQEDEGHSDEPASNDKMFVPPAIVVSAKSSSSSFSTSSSSPTSSSFTGFETAEAEKQAALQVEKMHHSSSFMGEAPCEDTVLNKRDVLYFSGDASTMCEVLYRLPGLVSIAQDQVQKLNARRHNRQLLLAVIAPFSALEGHTLKSCNFRRRFNAAVLAMNRHGRRIRTLETTAMRGGDSLLLEAGPKFTRHNPEFVVVTHASAKASHKSVLEQKGKGHAALAAAMVAFIAIASGSGWLPLLESVMWAACVFLVAGTCKPAAAMRAISGRTLVVVACAFALADGLTKSGAAKVLSDNLASLLESGGDIAVLAGLFMITSAMSQIIAPAACVSLLFSVAYSLKYDQADKDEPELHHLMDVLIVLMMAGSSSFLTPFSYQTNLMVSELGGYSAKDFLRFGAPLLAIQLSVIIIYAILDVYAGLT